MTVARLHSTVKLPSFSAHRTVLAKYWSGLGAQDLQAGKPGEAIVALRTALSYVSDISENRNTIEVHGGGTVTTFRHKTG